MMFGCMCGCSTRGLWVPVRDHLTAMTEFEVALRVTTAALTLAELSALLGRPSSDETSHNRGDPRRVLQKTRADTYPSTVWIRSSRAKRGAPLIDHFQERCGAGVCPAIPVV